MKFSQLTTRNAEAISDFYIMITEICANECRQLMQDGLRLLVLGNGAGVALLATILGVIIERKGPVDDLVVPLLLFLGGAALAACIYIPLILVSSGTAKHIGEEVEKFFKDEIEMEHLQNYGMTKRGTILVGSLLFLSILCFVAGVVLSTLAL